MFRRTDWFCMMPGIISMLLVLEIIFIGVFFIVVLLHVAALVSWPIHLQEVAT